MSAILFVCWTNGLGKEKSGSPGPREITFLFSAAKAINRIIEVFPGDKKVLVRNLLSESLQAIICQCLLKKIGGGRIAAVEILRCNSAIRNLIREDKIAQIYTAIQTGASCGMQTLDQHLHALIKDQLIDSISAGSIAVNQEVFKT